jgi:uncharacterized glyoxalase superfamily protein PhnB
MKIPSSPLPRGKRVVTPYVLSRNAAGFIEFLRDAFDAFEFGRVENPDGRIGHAEVRVGDSTMMIVDSRDGWQDFPVFLSLYVDDVDEVFQKALDAGATVVTQLQDSRILGDRGGRVCDPFGNIWWIQAHRAEVSPAEAGEYFQDPLEREVMRNAQETFARAMDERYPRVGS